MILLFAGSSCPECRTLKEEVFPAVLPAYGELVTWRHVAVDDAGAFRMQRRYERAYGTESPEPVKLFLGGRVLCGLAEIRRHLAAAVDEQLVLGRRTPLPEELP